jgi:F-type H+-transporting ATPase subunit epsilon
MLKIRLEIITAERVVYSEDVDIVVAPGIQGQLGILPHHAPLMTMLQPGELMVRKDNQEELMFVSGGFLEVRGDKVVVLADVAERADEIDIARAEAAKRRAEERIAQYPAHVDHARAEAALLRSMIRLRVAEKGRKRRPKT